MLRLGIVVMSIAAPLWGQGFAFTLGNPVAAQDFVSQVCRLRLSHGRLFGAGEAPTLRHG